MILGISWGASGGRGILTGVASNFSPHVSSAKPNTFEETNDNPGVNIVDWIELISKSAGFTILILALSQKTDFYLMNNFDLSS